MYRSSTNVVYEDPQNIDAAAGRPLPRPVAPMKNAIQVNFGLISLEYYCSLLMQNATSKTLVPELPKAEIERLEKAII